MSPRSTTTSTAIFADELLLAMRRAELTSAESRLIFNIWNPLTPPCFAIRTATTDSDFVWLDTADEAKCLGRFGFRPPGQRTRFLNRRAAGFTVYSADRFNCISIRRTDLDSHTWRSMPTNSWRAS